MNDIGFVYRRYQWIQYVPVKYLSNESAFFVRKLFHWDLFRLGFQAERGCFLTLSTAATVHPWPFLSESPNKHSSAAFTLSGTFVQPYYRLCNWVFQWCIQVEVMSSPFCFSCASAAGITETKEKYNKSNCISTATEFFPQIAVGGLSNRQFSL